MNPFMSSLGPDSIVPVIRPFHYVKLVAPDGLGCKLAGDVWLVFGADDGNMIHFPAVADGQKLGLPTDVAELLHLGLDNLARIDPNIELEEHGPMIVVTTDGGYGSSNILRPDLEAHLRTLIDGDLVVCIPTNDYALCTGSRSAEGLQLLRQHGADLFERDEKRISTELVVIGDSAWEPYAG